MKRWKEIDALRGLMLVLMTITHVPTRFSNDFSQPLGFVSAAEGFVFLSGFMASYIFSQRAANHGIRAMVRAFLRRAAKLYACHIAMLAYLFTIIALIGISTDRQAIKNLISFYLQEPLLAVGSSLVLLYNPPLLDILPMYVVFMIASPWLLAIGLRVSWLAVLTTSLTLWVGAQFGLARELYEAFRDLTGLKVPFHQTGAFDLIAWQIVWIIGLWLGARTATGARWEFPRSLVFAALFIAALGLVVRHTLGQAPFSESKTVVNLLDKWQLGPLRLVNFLALLTLSTQFGPSLKKLIDWRPLERLGAASLPVFCAHLAAVLLALALVGDRPGATRWTTELALLAATFAVMFATARLAAPTSEQRGTARRDVSVSAGAGR